MRITFALAALLFAGTLMAQESSTTSPDYSRPTLLRILSVDHTAQEERRVDFPFGAVRIEGRSTRWLIGYLPFLMPLSGSVNTGRGLGSNFPDPFALTNTQLAYGPRTWRDQRAMSRELRRIESEEKKRAKIKVSPE